MLLQRTEVFLKVHFMQNGNSIPVLHDFFVLLFYFLCKTGIEFPFCIIYP